VICILTGLLSVGLHQLALQGEFSAFRIFQYSHQDSCQPYVQI
jgi:hypothetical protein